MLLGRTARMDQQTVTPRSHKEMIREYPITGLVALCVQVVFLIYWLFSCPEVHGQLEVARDELQRGDADLPALTVRHSDSTETTVAYDRSKSSVVSHKRLELFSLVFSHSGAGAT